MTQGLWAIPPLLLVVAFLHGEIRRGRKVRHSRTRGRLLPHVRHSRPSAADAAVGAALCCVSLVTAGSALPQEWALRMTAHGLVPVLAAGTLRASSRSPGMAMGLPVGLTAVSIALACALPF